MASHYGWDVAWTNYPYHFDDVPHTMIAIFVIASGDTWHLQSCTAVWMLLLTEKGRRPVLNGGDYYGVYFVLVMILAGFFSFNFVVPAIFDKCIEVQAKKVINLCLKFFHAQSHRLMVCFKDRS